MGFDCRIRQNLGTGYGIRDRDDRSFRCGIWRDTGLGKKTVFGIETTEVRNVGFFLVKTFGNAGLG